MTMAKPAKTFTKTDKPGEEAAERLMVTLEELHR